MKLRDLKKKKTFQHSVKFSRMTMAVLYTQLYSITTGVKANQRMTTRESLHFQVGNRGIQEKNKFKIKSLITIFQLFGLKTELLRSKNSVITITKNNFFCFFYAKITQGAKTLAKTEFSEINKCLTCDSK